MRELLITKGVLTIVLALVCVALAVVVYNKFDSYNDLDVLYQEQSGTLAISQMDLGNALAELGNTQETLADTLTELGTTSTELSSVQVELDASQVELGVVEAELTDTQADLTSTQADLNSVQVELTSTQIAWDNTKVQLVNTQTELASTQVTLGNTTATLSIAVVSLAGAQAELIDIRHEIDLYNELGLTVSEGTQPQGFIQTYHLVNTPGAANPTWQQLESFLLADRTDEEAYIDGVYMCGQFARDVHNNAEAAGIRAGWAYIDFEGTATGHVVNVFITSDMGAVFTDCTSTLSPTICGLDKEAYVRLGELLTFTSIVDPLLCDWLPMGIVSEVEVYW